MLTGMQHTEMLSTVVVTPFAVHRLADLSVAWSDAQMLADLRETPVGIWARDGWFTICEIAPELIEPDPELSGWRLWAVADPAWMGRDV